MLVTPVPPAVDVASFFPLQILVYEGEMARAQGHLEAEMQNLEEEKNRVIEEAFIRAESEMKAVHENLAGQTRRLPALLRSASSVGIIFCCLSGATAEPSSPGLQEYA